MQKLGKSHKLICTEGLTELGKVVICKDPDLEALVANLVIHFQLSLSNHPL